MLELLALGFVGYLLAFGAFIVALYAVGYAWIFLDSLRPSVREKKAEEARLHAWMIKQPKGTFSWDRDDD